MSWSCEQQDVLLPISLTGLQKYLKWYIFCGGAEPGAEHLEWRLSVHLRPPPSTSLHCWSTLAFLPAIVCYIVLPPSSAPTLPPPAHSHSLPDPRTATSTSDKALTSHHLSLLSFKWLWKVMVLSNVTACDGSQGKAAQIPTLQFLFLCFL